MTHRPTISSPKRIVTDGYALIADRYLTWTASFADPAREWHTRFLLDYVPNGEGS